MSTDDADRQPIAGRAWRLAVLAVAGVVLLAVAAVGFTAVTTPACVGCHSDRGPLVDRALEEAHEDVDCVTCHVPDDAPGRVAFASRQLFGMTLGLATGGDRAAATVPDPVCLDCHADVMDAVVEAKGYRILHAECTVGSSCVDCHSATAHGPGTSWIRTAQMGDCLECHGTAQAAADCGLCHDEKTESERLSTGGPWRVTHGRQWQSTHGMGDLVTCAACHRDDYCARCHEVSLPHQDRYVTVHSSEALDHRAACEDCHGASFCEDCHGTPMPHPPTFAAGHSALVDEQGEEDCRRCHSQTDCELCHLKHIHPGGALRPPEPRVR